MCMKTQQTKRLPKNDEEAEDEEEDDEEEWRGDSISGTSKETHAHAAQREGSVLEKILLAVS
jgi:hypothetical protein